MLNHQKSVLLTLFAFAALQIMGCSNAPVQKKIDQKSAAVDTARTPAADQKEVVPFDHLKKKFDIRDFKGQTYLSFMKKTVFPAMKSFVKKALDPVEAEYPNQFSKWQQIWRETGDGVAIRIDDNNYYFNLGYRDGKDGQNGDNDVKSGRSYGVSVNPKSRSGALKQSDPSDIAYLTELQEYLTTEKGNIGDLYDVILATLLNCDASGVSNLSPLGQVVFTDFLAIYTAEAARHLMIDLKPGIHPWEIDLGAATTVAVFSTSSGQVYQDDSFREGELISMWAKGATGSGIGNTRKDRKKLQKLIAAYEGKNNKEAINQIESVIGDRKDDDVIQGLFEYLNNKRSPMKISAKTEKKFRANYLAYIKQIHSDAKDIYRANR